mgnify:CR=1 FL=1
MRWLVLLLFLSGCGLTSILPFGGSGGPTVNSNAQIGKENRQSVVSVGTQHGSESEQFHL